MTRQYLRAHGADSTILTQHFLKDDVDTYINRSELIEQLKFKIMALQLHMVLTKKFIISLQLRWDELLSLEGIEAYVVVAKREDN